MFLLGGHSSDYTHITAQLGLEIQDGFTHRSGTSADMAGKHGAWLAISLCPNGLSSRIRGSLYTVDQDFEEHP